MNKKTMKIAGWAMGLTLAVAGVGVAIAGSNKTALETRAVEQAYYTLACTSQSGNSAYATYYNVEVTNNTLTKTWNAPGNQTLGSYWRIGGKGGSSTSSVASFKRTITGKTIFAEAISSVKVNHNGTNNAGAVVNGVTLTVASDSSFNTVIDEVELTPTISKSVASDFTFHPTAPSTEWGANSYYKLTFDMTLTGKSNYGVDLTSVVFYQNIVSSDKATNLNIEETSISPAKGSLVHDALASCTITAQVNDASAAAYSNYSATITRRDNSVEEVLDSTVFKTGDKTITLTANDPTTVGGDDYSSDSVSLNVTYDSPVAVGNKYAVVADGNVFTCAVSSNLGGYTAYSDTPSGYGLVVENGIYDGTVAFKILSGTNANKYLGWNGNNAQLAISDAKNLTASWVVFNNGEDDIIANASAEASTLRFNSNRFCVYGSSAGSAPDLLLLGTPHADTFASDYMKMGSYDTGLDGSEGTGACKDGGLYADAKAYFNTTLTAEERALICDEHGLYADAYARLLWWADVNGDKLSGGVLTNKAGVAVNGLNRSQSSVPLVVTIAALGTAAAAGFFLFQRKRKEN